MTKVCTKCKETKSINDFHSPKSSWCKKCFNEHISEWDKTQEGRYSRYKRQVRARNKRGAIGHNALVAKKKTRVLSFDLTFDEFVTYWKQPCFYCGGDVETIGLDRVDNSLGYTKGNVVSCCHVCNWMKRDMSREDFVSHCTKISTFKKN